MIKVGIVGFGNLGKAVLSQIKAYGHFKLVCVFSRRDKSLFSENGVKFDDYKNIKNYKGKIDVMILCSGSFSDLEIQSAEVLKDFCTIDSFDTHKKLFSYYNKLETIGIENNTLALVGCGWDPGLFSMMRLLFGGISPKMYQQTFWGNGVSQGHSDAIRRIKGVLDARQYTIPKQVAIDSIKKGETKSFLPREKHLRECFVVAENESERKRIETEIKSMPNYFCDYDTIVHFVSQQELDKKHNKLNHGGKVLASFLSQNKNKSELEFSVNLESNPDFTASVLICFCGAVFKMFSEGKRGAITVFDVPLRYLSFDCFKNQIKNYL